MKKDVGACMLGVASLGIGISEILAPRQIENIMGLPDGKNTAILRTLGTREIMHGVDLLTHDDPAPGIFARVAGDVLDGVLLMKAATQTRKPMGFGLVSALVSGVVAMDLACALKHAKRKLA